MTENTPSDALVEAMARAIYEADDPWHVAWPWPDLQSDQAGVDHYRRCAEAAAAVVQAGLDDRVSTSSPVDDSGAGNMSVKPDIEAAVKSDTAPVSDKMRDAVEIIHYIAKASATLAHYAGVGGMETAGSIVSFLAANPQRIQDFMAGGGIIDWPIGWHNAGCLSWHGMDGKIHHPGELDTPQ